MPIYEYVCQECEHEFEELVRGDEKIACPKCQTEELQKKWSLPARPQQQQTTPLPTACQSQGPPCGTACSRWGEQ